MSQRNDVLLHDQRTNSGITMDNASVIITALENEVIRLRADKAKIDKEAETSDRYRTPSLRISYIALSGSKLMQAERCLEIAKNASRITL